MKPTCMSINAVCPIYSASDRKRPSPLGSATLLDFGVARFLITAAHVYDEYRVKKFKLYTIARGRIEEVPAETFFSSSLPQSGSRDDDRLDYAFVRLPEPLADGIAENYYFLPFQMIDSKDRSSPQNHYMFSGYPANRNGVIGGRRTVRPVRHVYTGITVPENRMRELGVPPHSHIVVVFDRENVSDDDKNQHGVFPLPQGMSGGPVWTGDGDFHLWLTQTGIRLVGIAIEDPKNQKVMIGVRIQIILEAMRTAYADIRKFIPQQEGIDCTVSPAFNT